MLRRLYFLFPDEPHARHAIDAIPDAGVDARNIHALTRAGDALRSLPAFQETLSERETRWEQRLWGVNLWVFWIALALLLLGLWTGSTAATIIGAAVMIATFLGGLWFTYLPELRLRSLAPALAHGEVLITIDVPKERVHAVEEAVRARHPEAVVGGVSWTLHRAET